MEWIEMRLDKSIWNITRKIRDTETKYRLDKRIFEGISELELEFVIRNGGNIIGGEISRIIE